MTWPPLISSGDLQTDASLRALATEDARVVAPAHLEAGVMRAWDAHQAQHRAAVAVPRWIPLVWRFAALAGVIAVSTLHMWWPSPSVDGPPRTVPGAVGPFPSDPLADRAALTVMRVRMSRSAFASLGFPLADPDAAGLVDVEVIVGEDGVARSIRRAAIAETSVFQE
jgi:hypothetical protein